MEKQKNAIGRRKEAVTRVFLSKGSGKITVNGKDYKVYFPLVYLQNQLEAPLKKLDLADKFDIVVNATGGGVKGFNTETVKRGYGLKNMQYRATQVKYQVRLETAELKGVKLQILPA